MGDGRKRNGEDGDAVFEIDRVNRKTKKKICKYRVKAIVKMCNTCCCKKGISITDIQSSVVSLENPRTEQSNQCKPWFTFVDAFARFFVQIGSVINLYMRHMAKPMEKVYPVAGSKGSVRGWE